MHTHKYLQPAIIFLLGFIMSKNPKSMRFYVLIESLLRNLSQFFGMKKPRREEYLPSQ